MQSSKCYVFDGSVQSGVCCGLARGTFGYRVTQSVKRMWRYSVAQTDVRQ